MNRNSTHLALAVLRIGFSGLLLTHGIPKIQELFATDTISFPDPIGLGATLSLILVLIAEVVGPLFVIIGYKTKLATIPTIIMMTVAVCVVHLSDPIGTKEMALLYLIGFIVIYLAGPGKYSIDKR